MKKIITLVLALGLVLGTVTASQAATDIRVGGVFDFAMGKVFNSTFLKNGAHTDFVTRERFRTWVDFIVSEQLKGQIFLEIGETNFGNTGSNNAAGQGFSIGGDGVSIEVRRAFIDWIVPNTKLQVRVGLQGIALPMSKPAPHVAFDDDMAGISLNYRFNDMVAMNLFWAVPYEGDDKDFYSSSKGANDDMNAFGLILPITGDGFKITPYGAYALIGENIPAPVSGGPGTGGFHGKDLNYTAGAAPDYGWWAGVAASITAIDPIVLYFDAMYGALHADVNNDTMGTKGFWLHAGLDYKASWGTPGIDLWYASGDDKDERGHMGQLSSPGSKLLDFGFDGGNIMAGGGKRLNKCGVGTWGIVLSLKDISFIEKMTHTFKIGYVRGTNDKDSIFNAPKPGYMTTKDYAVEFDFNTSYAIYDNLSLFVDTGVMWVDIDKNSDYDETGFKALVGLQYRF